MFEPDETPGRTSAELTTAEKDAISHRGHALRALAEALSGV
jgi:XTP/dITP diphosphohydrolase